MSKMCFGCVRAIVFLTNFVFWLLGAIVIGVAFYLKFDSDVQNHFVNSGLARTLTGFVYLFIGVGVFTAILSFLGCCGSYHKSQIMLLTFFSIMFLLFCIEIIVGAWLYSQRNIIAGDIDASMDGVIKKHYPQRAVHTNVLDTMQRKLDCCGWYSPNDYIQNRFIQSGSTPSVVYPDSCCVREKAKCGMQVRPDYEIYSDETDSTDRIQIHTEGCRFKLQKSLSKYVLHFVGFITLLTCMQAFAILTTVYLCCSIRKMNNLYRTRDKPNMLIQS